MTSYACSASPPEASISFRGAPASRLVDSAHGLALEGHSEAAHTAKSSGGTHCS